MMNQQFPNQAAGQGPVLNNNMPKLSTGLSRGVNKTAVAYIVLVSLAAIGMTLWVASNAFSADDDKKKSQTFEEVVVPDKPVLKLPPVEEQKLAAAAMPLPMPMQADTPVAQAGGARRSVAAAHGQPGQPRRGERQGQEECLLPGRVLCREAWRRGGLGQCRLHTHTRALSSVARSRPKWCPRSQA